MIAVNPREIFRAALPHRPYCAHSKGPIRPCGADTAINRAYIQPNPPALQHWLIFDVDHEDAGIRWLDAGLPAPTFVVQSPDSGRGHLLWGLQAPVCTSPSGRPGPLHFAAAVENTYAAALDADPGYTGLLCKNPLSPAWRVLCPGPYLYELGDLARWVDLSMPPIERPVSGLGRNCALFDQLRHWSYWLKAHHNFRGFDEWRIQVLAKAQELNNFPVPLPYSEVRATATSVAKWVWHRYTGDGNVKNRGIMNLPSTVPLKTRQGMGGRYGAGVRKDETLRVLSDSMAHLVAEGVPLTQKAVAELSDRSIATVKRYWPLLQTLRLTPMDPNPS